LLPDDFTPLWASIGYFLGDTAWLIGLVFLVVAGVGLFRVARHPATKPLKLSGFALIAWVALTLFGTMFHKAAGHPVIVSELGFTGMHVINVFFGLVSGVLDVALFGLFGLGALKAGRGVRDLVDTADVTSAATVTPAVVTPAVVTPAVVTPAPLRMETELEFPVPLATSVDANADAAPDAPVERTTTLEMSTPPTPTDTIVTAEERPHTPPPNALPDMEAILAGGSFARPEKVFTLREADRAPTPSLASREGVGLAELDDTREVLLPTLAADDDEHMREATLVEFPAVPPSQMISAG